jgi:subfamily B ATP-binding cassette protein MsbA
MTLTGLGTALVLWVAANRVIAGAVTVGTLWIFIAYMQRIYEVLQQNMNLFGMLQDSVVGVGRAFQILDTPPSITDRPGARDLPADRPPALALAAVGLRYDDDAEPVLRGIDLAVEPGEQVALVGATGSGKTSILNLVPRLYEATEGSVLVGGIDVRDLTLASLRDQIALVPQEPLLFSTTVKENILYGRRTASDDEVVEAARAAQAHDFITELADGYETEVGDRGAKLSIGQQQRLAIARAFLKDAPILLLDEPTSALDLGTEQDLLGQLELLMAGRTVVVVAHRLSTIRAVDRIYVLDRGEVVESGDHGQLLAAEGRYHHLYQSQFA